MTIDSSTLATGTTGRGAGTDHPGAAAGTWPRPRLTPGRELVTTLFGFWLMIGLFIDGWAHNNLAELETFFTPWHAAFYSGFAVTGLWIVTQISRNLGGGRPWTAAVPVGYGLGAVGLVVFLAGGLGDMAWHTVFGIEQDLEALFSPTHLLLFVGIALIMSSPLRSAWADPEIPAAPGYRRFLPVLLSVSALTALVAFMFMYWAASAVPVAWAGGMPQHDGLTMQNDLATVLASNLILLAPVLLLARRWRTPFGTATTLYGLVAVLTSALTEFSFIELALGMLVAGLAVDALLAWIRPATSAPLRFWTAATVLPLTTWSVYFATTALTTGITWSLEMWTGLIMWTGILGLALGLLMLPPRAAATT